MQQPERKTIFSTKFPRKSKSDGVKCAKTAMKQKFLSLILKVKKLSLLKS